MQQLTEHAKQAAEMRAVRDRLMRPQHKTSAALADLQRQLDAANEQVAVLQAELQDSEHDNSSLRAVIIFQAQKLCDESDTRTRRSAREIVAEVLAEYPNVTWSEVISQRRNKGLDQVRRACMVAVFEERSDLSFPAIGRIFKRDHTTILAAIRRSAFLKTKTD